MPDRNVVEKYPGAAAAFFGFVFFIMVFIFSHFQEQIAHVCRLWLYVAGEIPITKVHGTPMDMIQWDPADPNSTKKKYFVQH